MSWTIRPATSEDADEVTEVLTEAGVAAWNGFLGEERIRGANAGRHHPADLVAVDEDGVLGFVTWNAADGEIERLYTHPRGWGAGAGAALLDAALVRTALRQGPLSDLADQSGELPGFRRIATETSGSPPGGASRPAARRGGRGRPAGRCSGAT